MPEGRSPHHNGRIGVTIARPVGNHAGDLGSRRGHRGRGLAAIGRQRPVARNTVLTTITRLEEKGWLRHRSVGNTFVYAAVHPRQTVQASMAMKLIDAAFEGSAAGLVMTLLEGGRLPEEEAERIRAMLQQARSKRSKGRRKKP